MSPMFSGGLGEFEARHPFLVSILFSAALTAVLSLIWVIIYRNFRKPKEDARDALDREHHAFMVRTGGPMPRTTALLNVELRYRRITNIFSDWVWVLAILPGTMFRCLLAYTFKLTDDNSWHYFVGPVVSIAIISIGGYFWIHRKEDKAKVAILSTMPADPPPDVARVLADRIETLVEEEKKELAEKEAALPPPPSKWERLIKDDT